MRVETSRKKYFRSVRVSVAAWILVVIASPLYFAGTSAKGASMFSHPSLSNDNSSILMHYCPKSGNCTLAEYDIASAKLVFADKPPDVYWWQPTYSRSDEKIFFVQGKPRQPTNQIAFIPRSSIGAAGPLVTVVTRTKGYKLHPTVSPDETRVLYGKSTRFRIGTKRPAGFDLFEATISSGEEVRVTSHDFYSLSPPSYMPDGERVLFSGDGMGFSIQDRRAFTRKYGDNTIFIVRAGETSLRPILRRGDYSGDPSVSADGKRIVFVSRTNDLDNPKTGYVYDLFLREGSRQKRLTNLKALIQDVSISRDGTHVVFSTQKFDSKRQKSSTIIWLLNFVSGDLTQVKLNAIE